MLSEIYLKAENDNLKHQVKSLLDQRHRLFEEIDQLKKGILPGTEKWIIVHLSSGEEFYGTALDINVENDLLFILFKDGRRRFVPLCKLNYYEINPDGLKKEDDKDG